MRWKELLIGVAITLIVTVVAGILVWLITREPPPTSEDLHFKTDYVALSAAPSALGVGSVKVANLGSKVARNVYTLPSITGRAFKSENNTSNCHPGWPVRSLKALRKRTYQPSLFLHSLRVRASLLPRSFQEPPNLARWCPLRAMTVSGTLER
jgi:hypothetical protein